jgi:transposase
MERDTEGVASAADPSVIDGLTLETARARIAELKDENARLWRSYEQLKEELALIKRRMFVATAERVDTTQLQLEFEQLVKKLNALSGEQAQDSAADGGQGEGQGKSRSGDKPRGRPKPTGRRRLEDSGLPEVPVEIPDPLFEQLVAQGKAERIGFEESSKLAYERGGLRRVVIKRVKYAATTAQGETQIETAPVPTEVIPRCMASASVLALIATSKYCDGLPLYRIEQMFERWGFSLDRGTMSRWLEQLGATLGATVIEAAKRDALATAFCMMTDATGFAVQPGPSQDGVRRPCRKGHYFVQIADRDHIFFEFTPKETSENVRAMFKGFDGYLQADAKSVYDVLFRPPEPGDPDDDGCTRIEVGCWSHVRRKYWEAALAKQSVAREALVRIGKLFELDERYRKGNPPSKIKELRQRHLKPLVHEFLAFAAAQYDTFKNERGSLRSALGYCVRQADALTRFLEDGRLRMDNNLSESALRKVVIIRDSALFAGSDEHAQSAGHILSLIASARLHGIEPQQYLCDLIRVLPHWPRDRFLELAPKFWAATRSCINADQLAKQVGVVDIPPSLGA